MNRDYNRIKGFEIRTLHILVIIKNSLTLNQKTFYMQKHESE